MIKVTRSVARGLQRTEDGKPILDVANEKFFEAWETAFEYLRSRGLMIYSDTERDFKTAKISEMRQVERLDKNQRGNVFYTIGIDS